MREEMDWNGMEWSRMILWNIMECYDIMKNILISLILGEKEKLRSIMN